MTLRKKRKKRTGETRIGRAAVRIEEEKKEEEHSSLGNFDL